MNIISKIKFPLALILISVFFILIWKLLGLPPEEVLTNLAKEYFVKYGIMTVFIASIIEGMLVVGWYLPGGLVIFLGVILASGDVERAVSSVIATIVGFCIAYTLNYLLGKYGWYKFFIFLGLRNSLEKAEIQFQKHGFKAIIFSYWQPNLGALVSTSAGILKASFRKFFIFSTLATILWSVFWGTAAYFLGQAILEYLGIVFFGLMTIWILSIVIGHYFKKDVNISI